MYWLNVYEIPEGIRTGKGKALINLIKLTEGEKICAMLTVSREDFEDANKYIVMASRRGFIKKSELALFKNLRRVGLRALVIEEDDDLIGAAVASNGDELLLSTKLGMACRFDQNDDQIRPMGRTARGVTGMRFKLEGDEVVSLEVISEPTYDEAQEDIESNDIEIADAVEEDAAGSDAAGIGPEVLVVTDGGMGKRSFVSAYRKTNRGARGVVNIRLREGESVLAVVQITGEDELLLTTERGQLTRIPASEIRRVGRASLGVRIMNLNPNDRITGVAKLIKIAEESGADQNNSAEDPADGVEIPIETVVVPTVPETGADTAEVNGGEEPEA
jgi:DNA gyrase subunit A